MAIFLNVQKEDIERLVKKGFIKEKIKTAYEEARLTKGDVILVLYTSGKLLLQGRPEAVKAVAKEIEKSGIGEKEKAEHFRKESGWVIGSDEALKGDTFGGLVVAAVKADDKIRQQLIELGVQDSKNLSDKEVLLMAEKIKKIVPCEIKSLVPEEYNHHYHHYKNITIMLDKLHQETAHDLATGKHIVDKYPGCSVGDVQEEKAESKYVEVAAASVLARAAALQQLDYLSAEAGFPIPKGSTHVKLALMELKERKLEFRRFVKVDFGNVREFLK